MNLKKSAYFFVTGISILAILVLGRSLLIPFVFALLVWFIVRRIRIFMDKLPFIKNRIPQWFKNLLSFSILFAIFYFIVNVLASNINLLYSSYTNYEANANLILDEINKLFDIDLAQNIENYFLNIDLGTILLPIVDYSTDMIGDTFMVLLYTLFIFLEEASFQKKLKMVLDQSNKTEKTLEIIENIERSVAKYLGMKTLIGLTKSILTYIVLLIIGVDFPLFWAFLIFIFNYIPTIGPVVATLFPVLFCLLQFGVFTPAIMVFVSLAVIEMVIGNLLEPIVMGDSMNLSPLVTIIALSVWGAIWGITGMFLSVPMMVIVVIIFAQFPKTRGVALMLSGKNGID